MKVKLKLCEEWGINCLFMKTKKRTPLLRYWTTRYLLTLTTGLLVLSIFSLWWMEKTALEYRLSLLKYLADETADRALKDNGQIVIGPLLTEIIEEREKILHLNEQPIIYIARPNGEIIYTLPQLYIKDEDSVLPDVIIKSENMVQKVSIQDDNRVYIVKSPISDGNELKGWVVIAQEEGTLSEINQDHGLLAVMMGGLLILGWAVIYVLSRKISKPIQNVSRAAVQVREGNYNIHLREEESREEEIFELVESFKEMASRLKQMETLRAELFAGVTHDLKTPVTSISGLIQAVRDDVVTGAESKEFLDISLKETQRLQRMVEDLLDYNAMAAGSFKMHINSEEINGFLKDICYQWQVTQEETDFQLIVDVPEEAVWGQIDKQRVQEILINLLNNARQALSGDGIIRVRLYEPDRERVSIEVMDNGKGIPAHEQEFVFEPFYRGEKKKLKVRGLGLGLPFSKMLAQAQHGDLLLEESSEKGTVFRIDFKKASAE